MKQKDTGMVIGSAVGAFGAAAAAILGLLCCAGPAVVAVLGAGGALAAAELEPYRPYLLGAAFTMLAFGFWKTYVPSPVGGGVACSVRTGRVAKLILWTSAVLTAGSAILPRFLS